jgi:hypothetical protein
MRGSSQRNTEPIRERNRRPPGERRRDGSRGDAAHGTSLVPPTGAVYHVGRPSDQPGVDHRGPRRASPEWRGGIPGNRSPAARIDGSSWTSGETSSFRAPAARRRRRAPREQTGAFKRANYPSPRPALCPARLPARRPSVTSAPLRSPRGSGGAEPAAETIPRYRSAHAPPPGGPRRSLSAGRPRELPVPSTSPPPFRKAGELPCPGRRSRSSCRRLEAGGIRSRQPF